MGKAIRNKSIVFAFFMICLLIANGYSQENKKLAQTGFQFLSVISDARAAAMAEAMTSLQTNSSSLFFNPAGMAGMENNCEVSASSNQWIADIKHYTLGIAIRPFNGRYGVIGLSAQSVNYGDFYGTRYRGDIDLGYEDTGIFSLSAIAIGIGYAKQLTDQFCVGGQIRWIRQDLGESVIPLNSIPDTITKGQGLYMADTGRTANKLSPLIFDFGTQFKTGIKSLVFGMSVRNFSKEVTYAKEGFQAPLVFTIGISMNVLDIKDIDPMHHVLNVCIDASHYRDHAEQLKIGVEYRIMNALALRGGYITNNDLSGWSYGLGVSKFGFAFDYACTPFDEVFDKVQRMTARFSF
jgi:hypothetical protein